MYDNVYDLMHNAQHVTTCTEALLSERWGKYPSYGDALSYLEEEYRKDIPLTVNRWKKGSERHNALAKAEQEFSRNVQPTHAMEAAVLAVRMWTIQTEIKQTLLRSLKKGTEMQFKDDSQLPMDSNLFLKLKDDKASAIGVFRGDIYDYKQHWATGKKSMPCTGPGCQECLVKAPSLRFRVNFIVNENGTPCAKIFEQGTKVYKQLRELDKEWPIEKNFLKITRNGTGTDTTYSIMPIQNSAVTPEKEKLLAQVKLNDLEVTQSESAAQEAQYNEMEIPF